MNYLLDTNICVFVIRQKRQSFLAPLEIVDFDAECAECFGTIRAELESRGVPIGPLDTMIAAHALRLRRPLVTNNTSEFSRVPGLTLEDWTK